MKASELSEKFLIWFQSEYPEARIYRNNTGIAWREGKDGKKYPVKFGIPLPQGKKKGGGGADYIAFIPHSYATQWVDYSCLTTQFYEIKTATDKQSKNQKDFANLITSMGGEYYLVKELVSWQILEDGIKEKTPYNSKTHEHYDFYIEKWELK